METKILSIVFIATIFLFGISFVAAEPICGDDICEGSEVNVDTSEGCPQDCYTDPVILTPSDILNNELPQLTESTILTNKYYVEFDDAKTYTIWLYAEEEPTREQVQDFVTALATKLSEQIPEFYFNFNIFPEDSTKIPGDTQIYDTYANVVWRNNEVVFPVDTQPSIVCGDGVCDSLETPDDCPQDCYTDPIEEKPNNLIYWVVGIVIIFVLVILFLILRKKK